MQVMQRQVYLALLSDAEQLHVTSFEVKSRPLVT